jgi:YVTN family beta-propeller protein
MNNLRCVAVRAAAFGALALTLFLHLALAQVPPPSTTLLSSRAVAFNPATRKTYAVDSKRGAILINSEASDKTSSVKVSSGPVAIAVNPVTGRVYVANNGSGTVSVLDGQKDSVVATINVGALPYVLAVSEATNRIYVSNTFSNLLTIIDGSSNATTTVKTGSADAIAVDAKAGKVYLLGYEDTSLTVLDEKGGERSKVEIGMHMWGIALNEETHTVYVT